MLAIFSRRLWQRNPFLPTLLACQVTLRPDTSEGLTHLAGWGRKPSTRKVFELSKSWNIPYLALEDGFLRSLDLGVNNCPALSLVVDDVGIYYDATQPSLLENILNDDSSFTEPLLAEAARAMAAVVHHGLSKYNHAPELPTGVIPDDGRPRVLVVDQTHGDMSVQLGLADEESFRAMLDAALAENPEAEVVVKTHPDVLAGKKRGYLTEVARHPRVRLLAMDVQPASLIRRMERVYTVTSQMGFEALMHGKPVTCFGMPFYAGWGVTDDRVSCLRRTARRGVVEIFAAAYMLYARYVNPFTEKRCSIHEVIDILALARRRNEENRKPAVCLGFPRWKRPQAQAFLGSTASRPIFRRTVRGAIAEAKRRNGRLVVWSAKEPEGLDSAASATGVDLWRMEDGFLRSVGLGSDFHHPYSLIVDREGIYYDPSRPSRLESILERGGFDETTLRRARELREAIVAKGVSKYNVGQAAEGLPKLPEGRGIILVPGQVEGDASVRRGGWDIQTNLDLLKAVRRAAPDAFIIYKPHPDVESGNRRGRIADSVAKRHCDLVLRGISVVALFPHVHEVHTLTSLTGFEALLRGLQVHAYGMPFYAGWGLTRDASTCPRRTRRLSLDELVAGTLIAYPWYYDWNTGLFCEPEVVLSRLDEARARPPKKPANRLLAQGVRFVDYCGRMLFPNRREK